MSEDPYRAPQSVRGSLTLGDQPLQFSQTPQERNAGPEGLGGWLIVIAIKLVMTVLTGGWMLTMMLPLFATGTWTWMTTPGNDGYHPMLAPLIIFEIVGNIVLIGAGLGLLVMFFRKAPSFPRWMIALLVFGPLLTITDLYFSSQIPSDDLGVTASDMKDLAQMIAGACIWVPYLLVSKRVRNTFAARRISRRRIEPTLEETAAGNANA